MSMELVSHPWGSRKIIPKQSVGISICLFQTNDPEESCMHVCSVVSNSLWYHELQPTRLLCPFRIFQARTLEQVANSYSRGSSWPRDQIHISCISCIGRQIPYLGSPEEPGTEQRERLKATRIYPCLSDFIYKSSFILSHLLINNLLTFLNNNKWEFNNCWFQMLEPLTLELVAPWASTKNSELG